MCAYKHSPLGLESAKQIIEHKTRRESALLSHFGIESFPVDISHAQHIQELLLIEARAARHLWKHFRELLPNEYYFPGRVPGAKDVSNRLLDVGFHHLTNNVAAYLNARDVSTSLGLLHVPRTSDAAPLAYDLVELFRADIVDAEVLRYLRLKKKPITDPNTHIPHFLHEVNERLNRRHYLKDFKQCHTYRYYIELQILRFIHSVDHQRCFTPIALPDRHDSRCLTHKD